MEVSLATALDKQERTFSEQLSGVRIDIAINVFPMNYSATPTHTSKTSKVRAYSSSARSDLQRSSTAKPRSMPIGSAISTARRRNHCPTGLELGYVALDAQVVLCDGEWCPSYDTGGSK